jgi:hypothetical protein
MTRKPVSHHQTPEEGQQSLVSPLRVARPEDSHPDAPKLDAASVRPTNEMAEKLVSDTVAQVLRLTALATQFPEAFRPVARQMPAWPVMHFKREASDPGYWRLLSRLELAADYPVDTGSDARSHPSSPTSRYLSRWIGRLHHFRVRGEWPADQWESAAPELKELLDSAQRLPPLTKATSDDWSRRLLVPLIMLLDAGCDESSCTEPALQAIWRQKGVKSRGTFKSRLLTKVRQSLRSLARSA